MACNSRQRRPTTEEPAVPTKRYSWILAVCAIVQTAGCTGGEKSHPDTGAGAAPPSPPAAVSPGSAATTAAGTAQAITGKTWDVKMLGDAGGYRFDPPSLTIKRGDGVRWTVVTGQPHDVTFWADSIPPLAVPTLRANMPQTIAPLTGPLLLNPSQTYTTSFGGAPAGTYHYYCTPHLALGMKGTIIVQ
jgi:plastocyanin